MSLLLLEGCPAAFTGYSIAEDEVASHSHQLDDCTPDFVVSNNIRYPSRSAGPIQLEGMMSTTDGGTGPYCHKGDPDHCVIVGSSININQGATLQATGDRPLVLLAAHDITIDGLVDVSGGNGGMDPGTGDHTAGTPASYSGGGGNAEAGGGSVRGAGGRALRLADRLVPGGNGAPPLNDRDGCTAGGSGGGALQLVSLCGTVIVRGGIHAQGGAGAGGMTQGVNCPDGFGGGAGGTIWIQARQLQFQDNTLENFHPHVDISGGGGGGGSCFNWQILQRGGDSTQLPSTNFGGAGAQCPDGIGAGGGGFGGLGLVGPGRGGDPTIRPEAGLKVGAGGGGGARGRLLLESGPRCGQVERYITGACVEVPPVSP